MLGFAPLGGAPLGAPDAAPTGGSPVGLTDGVVLGDVIDVDTNNRMLTDSIQITSPMIVNWKAQGFVDSVLLLHDYLFQGAFEYTPVDAALTDGTKIAESLDVHRAQIVTVGDTIQIAEVLLGMYGLVVRETVGLHETLNVKGLYGLFAQEAVRLAELIRLGLPVTVADSVQLASLLDAKTAIRLVEAMRLAEIVQGSAQYNVQLQQAFKLADSLARFFGADVTDSVEVAALLVAMRTTSTLMTEGTVIEDLFGPRFLLSVGIADGIELTPTQALNMIYQPELAEGIEIVAGYLEPNGSFTTWAMNTRTAAVSEYDDFAFNSFAQVGNRYLGASADGLFELLGDDDAGTSIIARIKGGYMQFGGTQLSRLKEAYIAARGEGSFVLKVRTADGELYTYGVDTRNMRSTKVHMGKGQRSRYFGFELISAGQDFDLDTLEFVPIVVQRRV